MPYNQEQRKRHDELRRARGETHHGNYESKERQPTLNAIMTHDEIAKELGINRQRVQAIERNALKKLKRQKVLREYW